MQWDTSNPQLAILVAVVLEEFGAGLTLLIGDEIAFLRIRVPAGPSLTVIQSLSQLPQPFARSLQTR
jgi:hypothetical protein